MAKVMTYKFLSIIDGKTATKHICATCIDESEEGEIIIDLIKIGRAENQGNYDGSCDLC